MKICRTAWLASAASNRSPRHMQSLCFLIVNGEGFSSRERYLAGKLLRRMDGVVQKAVADQASLQKINARFSELEAQVRKRLDRPRQPPSAGMTPGAAHPS